MDDMLSQDRVPESNSTVEQTAKESLASLVNNAVERIVEHIDRKQRVVPPELSRQEAARYIGVSVDTLKTYQELGLIRYRNASPPGSGSPRYRYPLADLNRLMEQGYRRDAPRPAKSPLRRRKQVQPESYEHLDL
jgi:hypothetical protein